MNTTLNFVLLILVSLFGFMLSMHGIHTIDVHITSERSIIDSSSRSTETFSTERSTNDQSSTYYPDNCLTNFQHFKEDNNHQPMEFSCIRTIFNDDICMKNECPSNFYDDQIAHFCQTPNETEILLDFRLSIPVTSQVTYITYRNVFCAYCNDERHYTFWKVLLRYAPESSNISEWHTDPKFRIKSILSNIEVHENRTTYISKINDTNFECSVHASAPSELEESLRYCTLSSNFTTEPKLYKVSQVNFYDEHLLRFIEYDIENSFIADNKIYFQFEPKFLPGNSTNEKQSCFPAIDRTICATGHHLIKDKDFQFINNETIFFNETGTTFGPIEWSDTFDKNVIFLCQTAFKQANYEITYTMILVMDAFSIIFFLLLLWAIGTNKKKKQSLPNKVIFAYSLTMLALQITTSVSFWLPSCKVVGPIIHYSRLSRYVWLCILAFDFWRMIYYSINSLKQVARRPHLKRLSIYSLIGWISPLSILSVTLYLEFDNRNDTSCSLRPQYGRLIFCRMTHDKAIEYFENYPVTVTSCIIIILFINSLYHVYLFNRQKYVESRKRKDNFRILIKLAWTMGLAFIIALFSTFFQNPYCRTFFGIFDQSQGIILYFIHGHKYIFKNVYKTFKFPKRRLTRSSSRMYSTSTTTSTFSDF